MPPENIYFSLEISMHRIVFVTLT